MVAPDQSRDDYTSVERRAAGLVSAMTPGDHLEPLAALASLNDAVALVLVECVAMAGDDDDADNDDVASIPSYAPLARAVAQCAPPLCKTGSILRLLTTTPGYISFFRTLLLIVVLFNLFLHVLIECHRAMLPF